MRTVFYEFADGVRTTSYEVAFTSGKSFVTKVEPMEEPRKVDSIEEENKKDDNETIDDFVKKIFSNVSSSGKTSPNETENSQHNNIMSQSTVVQEQNLLGSGNKRGSMHTSSIAETNNTSANLVKEFDLNTSAMNRKYTFTNTVWRTIKNSFFMMSLNLPRTILMALVYALPIVVILISPIAFPLIILFGISLPGYIAAMLYNKVFKRFEPEQEEITSDENFTVLMDDETEIPTEPVDEGTLSEN